MLVKMVREKVREIKVPTTKKPGSYLPRLELFLGIIVMGLAAVSYFNFYSLPKIVVDVALFISGLFLVWVSFRAAYYNRRKAIAKKYL